MILDPDVETRPWEQQRTHDDARLREQLAYLRERSPFYRDRIVSTYNAGPFAAGAALASFDRIGLTHIPVGTGNTDRLMLAIERLRPEAAVLTPSYAAYLVEWAAEHGFDLAGSSVARVLV